MNRNHDYKLSTMDNDSGGKLIVHGYVTLSDFNSQAYFFDNMNQPIKNPKNY